MTSNLPKENAVCAICNSSKNVAPYAKGWDFEYITTKEEYNMVCCTICELLYLINRPVLKANGIIYPQNYYSFNESGSQNNIVKFFRDKIEAKKIKSYFKALGKGDKLVLDIGCGDGRFLDLFKLFNTSSWSFYGIEIGEKAAERALEKGYKVVYGDFEYHSFSDLNNTFDLILLHQVLEHTRNPRKIIQKINKLLKPGGIISIETPDKESWDHILFKKRYWGGYHFPRHFYIFNKKNISQFLTEEGFEVISCKSILSPVFWIHSLHNFLIDHNMDFVSSFANYQNPFFLSIATCVEIVQTTFFSKSSNMQILAKKTYS